MSSYDLNEINIKPMRTNRTAKPPVGRSHLRPVHLEFTHPKAGAVAIAGTFNDWHPEATPMILLGDGRWHKELVLPPGVYEYRLVVDGEWMADPLGQATSPNPFGGLNSVLKVTG